jgi:transcriptional regulator with PAS, ATPase and Fis domain
MKRDINDMKRLIADIIQSDGLNQSIQETNPQLVRQLYDDVDAYKTETAEVKVHPRGQDFFEEPIHPSEVLEESLSLQKREIDLITKALERHNGKRKHAARELGISERTLYRKIKEYNIK